jgi:hypothetical protein
MIDLNVSNFITLALVTLLAIFFWKFVEAKTGWELGV